MSTTTALRSLRLVLGLVAAYSLAMIVAGGPVQAVFHGLGFGAEGAGVTVGEPRDYVLFLQGVLGAVILGWVVLMLAVVRHGLEPDPAGPWYAMLVRSVGVWFVVDTGFSLAMGSRPHALFNLVFLVALAVPLAFLRPSRVGLSPRAARASS